MKLINSNKQKYEKLDNKSKKQHFINTKDEEIKKLMNHPHKNKNNMTT